MKFIERAKVFTSDLFRNTDGKWDLSRVTVGMMVVTYIAQSAYALWKGQHFDWQSFGLGAGSLIAGGGAGVWMHNKP